MTQRPNERRASAEIILTVAERMIGEHGINGVSLRQIAEAAGLAAPSAVQYHFGDKPGLVRAIVDRRQPWLETRRYELTQTLIDAGKAADPLSLVEAIFRPIAEIRDENGRASYALFLREVRQRGYGPMLAETRLRQPHLTRGMELLRSIYADVPGTLFWWRHKTVVLYILNSIIMLDEDGPYPGASDEALESFFNAACALYRG